MQSVSSRHALYYPFHLCREQTLARLLTEYASVHFRDYMALQLTAMRGTMAYRDRMGDYYPDLVAGGRIVQGYSVSGPLPPAIISRIDRDLADRTWRSHFHTALEDRLFQRRVLDLSHGMLIGGTMVPGPAVLLRLTEAERVDHLYTVETLQGWSHTRMDLEQGYRYEYGLALVMTAASLAYTVELTAEHGLGAVTDSAPHYQLLQRTCMRDHIDLHNKLIQEEC
jgi:hypothetical protein